MRLWWAISAALCLGSATCVGASELEPLGTHFRTDKAFPGFREFWTDSGDKEAAYRGEVAMHNAGKKAGASIHVFLQNTTASPVTIDDVLLQNVSLKQAVAFSEQTIRENLHPASIYFSKLTESERTKLIEAGEPVWWRVDPQPIMPGEVGEITVRLRGRPKSGPVILAWAHSGTVEGHSVSTMAGQPRFKGLSFSPALDEVYLYPERSTRACRPVRIWLDGNDVTASSSISYDPSVRTAALVIKLDKPLALGSYHCFKSEYSDGSFAIAGLRAWGDELAYGIWGSKPGEEGDVELARSYLQDIARHNINVQMEMVGSGAVSGFLKSDEGHRLMASLGIRRMIAAPGKGRTPNPWAYFLIDEPDAADFGVQGLNPEKQVGSLIQDLVRMSAEYRKEDPLTPHLLNVDLTFKPDNWYVYGQMPDIFASDPYYQARLQGTYWRHPGTRPMYSKATFIHAVSTVAQAACEPRPLHIILNSVSHAQKDRSFRYATPEEKRIEVYYGIGAGAKGISYWWYTPSRPAYGVGADDPEAKALWREIGLLGAELRTVGPLIVRSCPVELKHRAPKWVSARFLLAGQDSVVILCVNEDYASDQAGTVVSPIENAEVEVTLPSWLKAKNVFQVTHQGTGDIESDGAGGRLKLSLGTLDLTRLVVVTSDPGLRGRLQKLYEARFAANVRNLTELQESSPL